VCEVTPTCHSDKRETSKLIFFWLGPYVFEDIQPTRVVLLRTLQGNLMHIYSKSRPPQILTRNSEIFGGGEGSL
jgi:hypothetical protein